MEELFVSSSPTSRTSSYPHFVFVSRNDEPGRDLLSRPTNYLIIKFFHPPPLPREERAEEGCRLFGPFTMISLFYGGCVRRPLGIPCKRAMKAISTMPHHSPDTLSKLILPSSSPAQHFPVSSPPPSLAIH